MDAAVSDDSSTTAAAVHEIADAVPSGSDLEPAAGSTQEEKPGEEAEQGNERAPPADSEGASIGAFLERLHEANAIIQHLESRFPKAAQASIPVSSSGKKAPLFERRLELLFSERGGAGASESDEGQALPEYEAFPEALQLQAALMNGSVPDGHQKVASILYPDKVEWPTAAAAGTDSAGAGDSAAANVAVEQEGSAASMGQTSINQPLVTVEGEQIPSPKSLEASADETFPGRGRRRSNGEGGSENVSSSGREDRETKEEPQAIIVCNQKLRCRARGGVVVLSSNNNSGPVEDPMKSILKVDDSELKAATQKRKKAEKALALETYHEQKLKDRIVALERMKEAEQAMQVELSKKEERRKARKAELQKLLLEGQERRQEAAEQAEEDAEEQKEKDAKAAEKKKEYHKKQKDRLVEWEIAKFHPDGTPIQDETETVRPQEEPTVKTRAAHKQKTPKELEAEKHIKEVQQALEERPPMPVLARQPLSKDRPPKLDMPWTATAKAVSQAYDLSPEEHDAVTSLVTATARGPGRMAAAPPCK
mmetsp:Transcript_60401/g.143987  ORF Transcript_60401/g.143987 Transcript_60401/m.143987 type:complete len:538 (-) Transcript_60401:85-1698(-)